MTTLLPRIRKLVAALIGINGYAQHDDDCQADNASDTRRCTCGYRDAWKKAQQVSVLVPALLAEAERVEAEMTVLTGLAQNADSVMDTNKRLAEKLSRFIEPPSEEVVREMENVMFGCGCAEHLQEARQIIDAYRKAVMEGK